MKIFVVRLNPDTRSCKAYSKYPTLEEYTEIHNASPMDGFHEAMNFLPEKGIVRGYLPPRHASALRDGEPFCLITITAKTAKIGGDKIVGVQTGCLYSGETPRIGNYKDAESLGLAWHYYCQESTSLLFSEFIPNAKESIIESNNINWIWGPVKEIDINAFTKISKEILKGPLTLSEQSKFKNIIKITQNGQDFDDFSLECESSFEEDVISALGDNKKAKGNKSPQQKAVISYLYVRDPAVVAYALKKAKGICGACGKEAPFISKSTGLPYLEVHHEVMLKDGGQDTPDNVIALCPNCHREKHYG